MFYLLALSIAGCTPVGSTPESLEVEAINSDPTNFVQVPLSVLLEYHARAKRCAEQQPEPRRLPWLKHRDFSERAAWMDRFRNSTRTLGKVIQDTMRQREHLWSTRDEDPRYANYFRSGVDLVVNNELLCYVHQQRRTL
mgnify:CR=1 FL=1